MMPANNDYFDKPRTINYFDDLLTNNPDKLFRKYAVHPADSSQDYEVPTSQAPLKPILNTMGLQVEAGAVPPSQIVAYCHLEKKSRTASLMSRMEGADCIF